VSRGSFYWHSGILPISAHSSCEAGRSVDRSVIRELDARKAEPDRLKHLMKRAFAGKRDLDRAIRSGPRKMTMFARIVASADARRVAYIAKCWSRQAWKANGPSVGQPFYIGPIWVSHCHGCPPFIDPESAIDDIGDLFEREREFTPGHPLHAFQCGIAGWRKVNLTPLEWRAQP